MQPSPSDAGTILIRLMSKTEGQRNQQPHVALRVRAFVMNHLFHKIKFISNDAMVHQAMKLVMDNENVPQHQRYYAFQTVYTSTFNFGLNSKAHVRRQVRRLWWMKPGPNLRREKLFTIEELCKLRWAETQHKKVSGRFFTWHVHVPHHAVQYCDFRQATLSWYPDGSSPGMSIMYRIMRCSTVTSGMPPRDAQQ
jgi:hypothetical protein